MVGQGDEIEKDSKKKILILAANPKDTTRLRFDEEVSKIEEGIQRSKYRDLIEIKSKLAMDYTGIRRALLDYEPNIVHFIGHGNEDGIEGDSPIGFANFISSEELSDLFEEFSKHVKCVIINACYSAIYADEINKHIDYVIGMLKEINDKAAIEFAVGFYDGLGAGKSVEESYQLGCKAAKRLTNGDLISDFKKKEIPEKQENAPYSPKTNEAVLQKPVSSDKKSGKEGDPKKSADTEKTFEIKDGSPQIDVSLPGPAQGERKHKLKLIIALVLLVFVLGLSLYFLLFKPGSQFGLIKRVESKGNILIAFNAKGKYWEKKFNSHINQHCINDIDQDKKKDILVGFSAEVNEGSLVIALDSERNEKWRFYYTPSYPVTSKVKMGVSDIKVFDENQDRIIAVILKDEHWDLSALVILDPKGNQLKEFWYPGYMQQIERIKNTYIIWALNNDLRQAKISKNLHGNYSVIFGIKYENIYGEAPPYLEISEKKGHVEWYFFLSDSEVKFDKMCVRGEIILASSTCGMRFSFNENGLLDKISPPGGHSCKDSLRLVKLGITRKENGQIHLSIPSSLPTIKKPTEKPLDIESNLQEELRDRGLLGKLREASAYCDSGSYHGENKALTLYREVIEVLSPQVRKASTLLNDAEDDFRDKHNIHALRKYKTLFDKVIKDSEAERAIIRQSPGNIAYLKYKDRGDKNIELISKGNKVILTSKNWKPSGFWIKFKNYSAKWEKYDKIYLKVDYSETPRFDQSAMLKLQLNEKTLRPIDEMLIQLGSREEDQYLMQSKGRFFYPFEIKDLKNDNKVTITLNKGQWQNFCIELALIKNDSK